MAAIYEPDTKVNSAVEARDLSFHDVSGEHVEPKFRGTEEDRLDMKVLGRTQETRRIFTTISMLA